MVPVVHGWASADDDEALAYLVASNESTIAGGWVNPLLADTLEQIGTTDLGLVGTGFTAARLDLLLSEIQQAEFDPESGGTDPAAEWERTGMPGFAQDDRLPAYSIHLHFASLDDARRFFAEILDLPEPRRVAWWPKPDELVGSDRHVEYVSDGTATA
jgi:hypothetical protein